MKSVVQKFYTPWLSRSADNAVFAYEVLYSTLPAGITVKIYHKDAEDAGSGPGSPVGSFTQLGTTSIYQASVNDLKEMIRFEVEVPAAVGSDESVAFRFLPPTWYSKART
jgi:hypothetical protein